MRARASMAVAVIAGTLYGCSAQPGRPPGQQATGTVGERDRAPSGPREAGAAPEQEQGEDRGDATAPARSPLDARVSVRTGRHSCPGGARHCSADALPSRAMQSSNWPTLVGLCVLVSAPGFAVGHLLREGALTRAGLLAGLSLFVIAIAAAIAAARPPEPDRERQRRR